MRIKLNGIKYKYKSKYFKREDELNVKLPSYSISRYGEVLHKGEWKGCRFFLNDRLGKSTIEICPSGIVKDGISEIGKVNSQGYVELVELSKFKRFKIRIHDYIFLKKIHFLSVFDKINLLKKNLKSILFAIIGAVIYFLINLFYDNFLQELINKSNFAQSIIVFLSLSSIINIFTPFTLRKEWTIDEIDELIKKRLIKNKEDLEHEKWAEKNSRF